MKAYIPALFGGYQKKSSKAKTPTLISWFLGFYWGVPTQEEFPRGTVDPFGFPSDGWWGGWWWLEVGGSMTPWRLFDRKM